MLRRTILSALGAVLSSIASASDGVLEINQACASAGCFPGDAAGFPVTIGGVGPKSYRLTSDLVVIAFGVDVIQIASDHVSLDLNGFSIRCTSFLGGVCDGTGTGINGGSASNVAVHGGTIQGMSRNSIVLGAAARVERVRALGNGLHGIVVGDDSTVANSTADDNGSRGIIGGDGLTVAGNTASRNDGAGIDGGPGSTVSGNTAKENGSAGILVRDGSTIRGNSVHQNGSVGIVANAGSTVSGNTATDNRDNGISASSGSLIVGNTVHSNSGFGLNLVFNTGYRENVITSNAAGTVDGGGVNMGNNSCNGTTTCP